MTTGLRYNFYVNEHANRLISAIADSIELTQLRYPNSSNKKFLREAAEELVDALTTGGYIDLDKVGFWKK